MQASCASMLHSRLNCLKGQNYAVSQHFVSITSDGNQHSYTHGICSDSFLLSSLLQVRSSLDFSYPSEHLQMKLPSVFSHT